MDGLKLMALCAVAALSACGAPCVEVAPPAAPAPAPAPTSNYAFQHEQWLEPRLVELRRQEDLDGVVAGARTEQEIFEELTRWTRRQFEPGFPDPYPLSNGLDILADVRSGRTHGFCGQYSYLLADALKSLGFFDVRYVEIGADASRTHFLVEVWSNEGSRWMLLDPLHATLVEDAVGTPCSAWQVHRALAGGQSGTLHRRWLLPESDVPRDDDGAYFGLYARTAVSLRNDLAGLDHPWSIAERQRDFLQIESNLSNLPDAYENRSRRPEDFTAPRNVCSAEVAADPRGLRVRLGNGGSCAHFESFETRLDGGAWHAAPAEFVVADPFTTLSCRTVNRAGIRGPVGVARRPSPASSH